VELLIVDGILGCAATKNQSHQQVEVGLEQVDDAEFIQLEDACLLVNHHINDINPAEEVHAMIHHSRIEGVDSL
jgi:hypothetical protein